MIQTAPGIDSRPARAGRPWASLVAPENRVPVLVSALVFLVVMGVYWVTISPSASFWDSGEFIAVSYTLGLPHPPGTPLYIVVGRLFSLLPFQEVALGVNLLSALSGALAILFLHLTVVKIVSGWRQPGESARTRMWVAQLSGASASLFAAFGATYWTNCIEAEVYAPSAFITSFTTWLMLRWADDPTRPGSRNILLAVGYLLALGIGYHLGTYLAAPCFVLFALAVDPGAVVDRKVLLGGLLLTIVGLSVHFLIPIRSHLNPDIDENNPETWANFWYYVGRKQYKPNSVFDRQASWAFQFDMFWRYFTEQFGHHRNVVLALLGVLGVSAHGRRHRPTFILLGALFLITSLGLIVYMNFTTTEVRERDYFYSPAFFTFAAWMGMGAGLGLEEAVRVLTRRGRLERGLLVGLTVALLLYLSFVPAVANFHEHDRRGDYNAYEYGYNMLVGLDKDAIIFTNGDNDTFPLWFLQEVKGFRRDVRVVNLSLLNTDWYIWQLKHRPPQVPVSIPDEQLPLLQPMRARDGRVLYVRDIAMYDIINTTAFRRPIYFAVTVPGLEEMGVLDHLVLEGLVFRLVPEKKTHMDLAKTEENMWEKYHYRGLLTPDGRLDRTIYRDPNTTSLVTNYSAAHIQLALEYMRRGEYAKAIRDCERAGEISPGYAPYMSLMGPLYAEAGEFLKAEEFLQRRLAQNPRDGEAYLHLGYTLEREGRTEEAMDSYRRAIELDPNLSEAYRRLAGQLFRLDRTDEAADLLEKWLELHPEDTGTARTLQELRQEGAGGDSNRLPARTPVLRKVSPPPRATVPAQPQ